MKDYTTEQLRKELAKPRDPESLYKRTPQLLKELEKLVNREIRQESRKHAMSILKKCTGKTVMEFLFFAMSGNGNLACSCLDFAFDKNGKHLKNKSFGNLNLDSQS